MWIRTLLANLNVFYLALHLLIVSLTIFFLIVFLFLCSQDLSPVLCLLWNKSNEMHWVNFFSLICGAPSLSSVGKRVQWWILDHVTVAASATACYYPWNLPWLLGVPSEMSRLRSGQMLLFVSDVADAFLLFGRSVTACAVTCDQCWSN